MKVAVESPYAPKFVDRAKDPAVYAALVDLNERFARAVCRYVVRQGHNPYAMHLFFTQFLDDTSADDRMQGINSGLAWTDLADEVWFCLRPGEYFSSGMLLAVDRNTKLRPDRPTRLMRFNADGTFAREEAMALGMPAKVAA